jgi:CheY-like chemotaxis protein
MGSSKTVSRILVIDDELSFLRMLKLNLERTGRFEVYGEPGGGRALEAAKRYKPDLILLDVVMPDVDGETIAKQLKADPDLRGIPIVFLTATVTRDQVEENAKRLGDYVFLAKPAELAEVIACIERNLPR